MFHLTQALALSGVLAACTTTSEQHSIRLEPIVETNITDDINLSSGEPEIAVDPTNSRNLAIIEFAVGSAEVPAWKVHPLMDVHSIDERVAGMVHDGRLRLSTDGGHTWITRDPPAVDSSNASVTGAGDPMIAYGPDGTLYAADEPMARDPAKGGDTSVFSFVIAAATDGGKTFATPQHVPTPIDRPWLKVDQTTGTVYTVSSGTYDPQTKVRNQGGPGAIMDRWLIAWKPRLGGRSEPRRLGGPDFPATRGSTITAANGVVAATFILGGRRPNLYGSGPGTQENATPVPASLKSIMKGGIEFCSAEYPCLFFETSADEGEHWTRHHVIVSLPGGFYGQIANVAADPGRPGRYAIGLISGDQQKVMSLVTDDSGETWSGPFVVPEAAQGIDFKQWMDYGSTGVLGFIWRKERADLTPPPPPVQPGRVWGPAYDIYASISCDGGRTWVPSIRINAESSPAGSANQDDVSYIALDTHNAHLVWGDRRVLNKTPTQDKSNGGIQTYYARVPLATATKGAACGRS